MSLSPSTPSAARAVPWHCRLEARVLICVSLVAGFSMMTALLAADRIVTSHSMRRSEESLRAAHSVFNRLAYQRADFAMAQLRLITELPVFRASVDTGDRATVGAVAAEYPRKLGAEFCVVTGQSGRWLGQPGWPGQVTPPPALQAAIRAAQTGTPSQSYMVIGRHLYLVASEPSRLGEEVLGTLTAGYPLDDTIATQLARMTGCEVSFVFEHRLCGSSLKTPLKEALEAVLMMPAGRRGKSARTASMQRLAGTPFVDGTYPLSPTPSAEGTGKLLLLQAWLPTQGFLDEVKTTLAVVLGIAFALALGGGLIVSRRITRPLRDIVAVVEEVAGGNWECRAPQHGSGEVAVMAGAFNQMTANLRHWYHEAQSRSEHLAETLVQLQHAHRATLEALSRALDARDNETEGHSLRVAHYATCLAQQMEVDPETLSALRWGALLHDIGKIGVADAILHKPGKLTPDEMREMQRHCEFGLEIVRGIPYLERAADVVGFHHERYDGHGYPNALSGERIPLVARIFSVADTLDAITSDRPYRRAGSFPEALAEIQRHSGTQFDPRVVGALEQIIAEMQHWRFEAQPREAGIAAALETEMVDVSL